jgi:hypothetical protein
MHPKTSIINDPIRIYQRKHREAFRQELFLPVAFFPALLKLNLGSGQDRRPGYVNVDKFGAPDLKCDLAQFPWPWPDNSVDEVVLKHVLDHLSPSLEILFGVVKELYRVCKHGAIIFIAVTHPSHESFISDPTHVRAFTADSFSFYSKAKCREWKHTDCGNTPLAFYLDVDFRVAHVEICVDPHPKTERAAKAQAQHEDEEAPPVREIKVRWEVNKPLM